MNSTDQIPKLFRTEYSKLVAVLCKAFGLSNIQIAEDAVGDTFLLASENWKTNGLPDNPTGWLYTVAKNKIRDHLKRQKIRVEKVEPFVKSQQEEQYELKLELSQQNIQDSQLQMIFAVCHPILKEDAQISLALRILCGFGIDEISTALLSNKGTINKRLFRAKQKLKEANIKIEFPEKEEISKRLDTVLTTLYLLFSEGYYSAAADKILRKDFCLEAMRLTLLLTQNTQTNLPKVNALLSLMCFHASRFEARLDEDENFVLYNEQDRNLWDKELITRGEYFLNASSTGENLSKYHLEAAIAFWHTQTDNSEKWDNILQLYNYLLQVDYSPIAALNRTYALAQVEGKMKAITEALKINLSKNLLYHSLLAELYDGIDAVKRLEHLKSALSLAKSEQERKFIKGKIDA